MNRKMTDEPTASTNRAEPMPVLFVGHGTPMNAIEENAFSKAWRSVGKAMPKPKAILCISAHWETWSARVTAMEKPRTIHDFGGFPQALSLDYTKTGPQQYALALKQEHETVTYFNDQPVGGSLTMTSLIIR